MIRLGFWIVLAALACMAVTFLPAALGDSSDLEFAANTLLCDGDRAVLSINLSEAALAKGNLGSVVSGFCTDAAGRLITNIPIKRVSDLLTAALITALVGIVLIGIGLVRRPRQALQTLAPAPVATSSPTPTAAQAQRTRERDAEDVSARRTANAQRSAQAAAYAASHPSQPYQSPELVPDWMAGMPAADLSTAYPPPSQRFDFASPAGPAAPTSDLQIQLNQLRLAYESSLITRSEYDARYSALLRDSTRS